ncbi:MAG: Fe-S cluster assembly protein SufD [Arsenophonus endosymbiont of Ceratovacuna japonica]
MVGLLTNNKKIKDNDKITILNQKALRNLSNIFYNSKRAHEKQAQKYWKQVEKNGFFSLFNKDYDYESIKKILDTKYQINNNYFNMITLEQLKKLAIPIDGWKIILFDGYFLPNLNSNNFGPYKIQTTNISIEFPTPIINDEIFLYLIESLAIKPILIKLPSNNETKKPLYILNITSGINNNILMNTSHYRYHLDIGSNCKSQVIEHFISIDNNPHLTGSRLTVNIGKNSKFNHIKLILENNQSKHFSYNDILAEENSEIISSGIFIGSMLLNHNDNIKLNGSGSKLILNSLSLPKNMEIINIKTYLEHNQSFCKSNQLHKIIAQDKSKAIFNGIIKVAIKAFKTDGKMTNNNLLLGKQAEINIKPQLEIYTNDVKCSHGATVGKINYEQLFYLCSRGIYINDAKYIIIIAFASEIIEIIDNKNISNYVMDIIQQRLMDV